MKRIKGIVSVVAALIIVLSSFTVFAESSTTYKIDELFMSIVPETVSKEPVTTVTTKEDEE